MTRIILPTALLLLYACGSRTIGTSPAPECATVEVWRVEPTNHNRRPSFGYEFKWRGIAAPPTARATSPGQMVELSRLVPLVGIQTGNHRCGNMVDVSPVEGLMITMHFGRIGSAEYRIANLHLDASGKVIRYAESRGDLRVSPNPAIPVQPVSNPGHRSDFTIDLVSEAAVLVNIPSGGVAERFVAMGGAELLDAPNLGFPNQTIALMKSECR